MGLPKSDRLSVSEYLRRERAAGTRHEFLDGAVFAMAGESGPHGDISANLVGLLHGQLRGKPCRVRTKDTKVRSGPEPRPQRPFTGLFAYPDVVVICGEPEYHDEHEDVVLNPTLIAEVLSPSTESFDRGEKFARYQTWNPSLREYLLIGQDRPRLELFEKQDDGTWTYRMVEGLEETVVLPSIGCTLKLGDLYERIEFGRD